MILSIEAWCIYLIQSYINVLNRYKMKGCNVARYLRYEKSFPSKTFGEMFGVCLLSYLCNTKTTKKYIAMKKFVLTVIILVVGFISASAQIFGVHQVIAVLSQEHNRVHLILLHSKTSQIIP